MMKLTVAAAALLGLAACSDEPTSNQAAAPEPAPTAQELAQDADLADQAAEAEALDAEIGGNNSGADSNLQ